MLHALLVPEELAVRRVEHRVAAGGHGVAEHKIRERRRRLWTLVAQAVAAVDTATVYDNSAVSGPRIVAQFQRRPDHRLAHLAALDSTGVEHAVAALTR